jgi:hypothetical protein
MQCIQASYGPSLEPTEEGKRLASNLGRACQDNAPQLDQIYEAYEKACHHAVQEGNPGHLCPIFQVRRV